MAPNDAAESRSNYSAKNRSNQPDVLRSIDTDQNYDTNP